MRSVLVSDIFGLTDELIELSNSLGKDTVIIDPYEGKENLFSDEKLAYQYFVKACGLNGYSQHILHQVLKIRKEVDVIGFSVGASAIWSCSNQLSPKQVRASYLFYGSQIRNGLDILPKISTNIVLPQYEDHFSVLELGESLKRLENVTLEYSKGLHGFMNKLSCNYNQVEYEKYLLKLRQYIA